MKFWSDLTIRCIAGVFLAYIFLVIARFVIEQQMLHGGGR